MALQIKGEGTKATCQNIVLREHHDKISTFTTKELVFRKEAGEKLDLEFLVSKAGQPQPDVEVEIMQLCNKPEQELFCSPKLPLPVVMKTNEFGVALISIKLPIVKTPRKIMDGQVYQVAYYDKKKDSSEEEKRMTAIDQSSSLVIKVFDYVENASEVTWVDHIYPIFSQYANLFPVMKGRTFDISNYHSVVKMKNMVIKSLNLPLNHSSYMPVTRDLSQRKRRMIVNWLSKEKPRVGKIEKLMSLQHLRSLLQTALEVEHATLPPYLTALWSIRDGYNKKIHRIIKTIVKQEMLHMGLVANIINSVGGHPSFTHSTFILPYPSKLPGGLHPNLIVPLEKLSVEGVGSVFMKIEEPDSTGKNKELRKAIFDHVNHLQLDRKCKKHYNSKECEGLGRMTSSTITGRKGCPLVVREYLENLSGTQREHDEYNGIDNSEDKKELLRYNKNIAVFYTHVLIVLARLTNCGADESIFTGKQELQISTDSYRYGYGRLMEVSDYVSAITAIKVIVEEGEGTSECDPMVHYIDSHDDISHYSMFETISKGHQLEVTTGEGGTYLERNDTLGNDVRAIVSKYLH